MICYYMYLHLLVFMLCLKWQEIVPLRKMCRRPETDYRLEILHAAGAANAAKEAVVDSVIA